MRTIAKIKKTMTDEILADPQLVQSLGLDTEKSWEAQVSTASVLNIIIYIVAVAHNLMERLFDQFKGDVEDRITVAYPGSVAWLWNRAMEYQDNSNANAYFAENGRYASTDEDKQIVKYAAVVEEYNTVTVKVSGANYDPLTEAQLTGFSAYMNNLKFAGVHLAISSIQSDDLTLTLRVWPNRLVMPEGNDSVIENAVKDYLNGIRYGGVFNKTKLIDALQEVTGVTDATIESCVFYAHDNNQTVTDLSGQNYKSIAGHINLKHLTVVYE